MDQHLAMACVMLWTLNSDLNLMLNVCMLFVTPGAFSYSDVPAAAIACGPQEGERHSYGTHFLVYRVGDCLWWGRPSVLVARLERDGSGSVRAEFGVFTVLN